MRSREDEEDGGIPLRRHPDAWTAAVLGAALGAVAWWTTSAAVADQANLAVTVARGFVETGAGSDPSAPGPTSPLHTALLVVGGGILGEPALAAGLLACACLALCGWTAVGIAENLAFDPRSGWLALALVATSPFLAANVAREGYLTVALLFGVTLVALRKQPATTGLLCGLAALTRPDLAVPALVLATVIAIGGTRGMEARDYLLVGAVTTATAAPWYAFSWLVVGDGPLAMSAGIGDGPGLRQVMISELGQRPLATVVGLVLVAIGVISGGSLAHLAHRPWAQLVLRFVPAGVLHTLVVRLLGGEEAEWYFAPLVAGSAVTIALVTANFALEEVTLVVATVVAITLAAIWMIIEGPGAVGPVPHSASDVAKLPISVSAGQGRGGG